MDRILEHLTRFAQGLSYSDLPEEVVERAKYLVIDTVGCALGGSQSPPAAIATAAARELSSSSPATVLVSGVRTSPDLAAFANGVMIRYLDFNDTYTSLSTCHPSDVLAPVLSVVEATRGSGRDVILGMALGYEVLCGLMDSGANDPDRGWDQATYGVVAAAVLAAKLFGLKGEQMANAVSLAASSHITVGEVRRGQISHWKGCALANASRNAVFAAMLAGKGMTGPSEAFEGKAGFMNSTGIHFELPPLAGWGEPWRIMRARVKAYPSGYFSQSAIEAVLELRPRISSIDRIKKVRLETFTSGYQAMASSEAHWKPETRETADHSLPFVMAVALMEGGLEIRHYSEEYYKRPDVRALMQKISVRVGDESEAAWPEVPLNVLEIELTSGEKLSTKVAYHLGHFERLMDEATQERKFRMMAEALLSKPQTDSLLASLRRLDHVERIEELISLTLAPAVS